MSFIGEILFIFALSMIWERRRRKKGIETWEYKHGIEYKKWHVILCLILGIALIFLGTLQANLKEFDYGSIGTRAEIIVNYIRL